jgi:cold-inducible RNA-binding protein
MKMYVGNLSFQTTKQDIQDLFSQHGQVTDVHLPVDRDSGQPRGFAFVTMGSSAEMNTAIKAVDGQDLGGRKLKVNEAQAREERGGGGGGGGRGYGGGGGGGYGGGGGKPSGGGRRY